MINRVVMAGKILEGPTVGEQGDRASMVLEAQHPRWNGGFDTCRVEAVVFGRQRASVVKQYLKAGRHLLVHGHLERDGADTRVVVERFSFMMDDLTTRYLNQEAFSATERAA